MACFYFLGIFFLSTGGTFKVIWRYRRLIPLSITAVHSFEWLIFLKQKKQNQNSYKHSEGTPANLVHPGGSGVSECHECVNIHFHLRSQWWCGLTCLFFFVRISWWEYISCYWDDRELGSCRSQESRKRPPPIFVDGTLKVIDLSLQLWCFMALNCISWQTADLHFVRGWLGNTSVHVHPPR